MVFDGILVCRNGTRVVENAVTLTLLKSHMCAQSPLLGRDAAIGLAIHLACLVVLAYGVLAVRLLNARMDAARTDAGGQNDEG